MDKQIIYELADYLNWQISIGEIPKISLTRRGKILIQLPTFFKQINVASLAIVHRIIVFFRCYLFSAAFTDVSRRVCRSWQKLAKVSKRISASDSGSK